MIQYKLDLPPHAKRIFVHNPRVLLQGGGHLASGHNGLNGFHSQSNQQELVDTVI